VPIVEKGSTCGKATKGTPTEEAGMPCKEKSTGKKVKENRGREDSAYGQAMRSTAKGVKEKFGTHLTMEGAGAL